MIRRLAVALVLVLLLLSGALWAGFQIDPPVDPPDCGTGELSERTVLYDGLSPALQFYLQQTAGRAPWMTSTAVVWGTAHVRWDIGPATLWLPMRWYEAIDAERGYVWHAEITWWNRLLFSMNHRYVDGIGEVTRAGEHVAVPCSSEVHAIRLAAERFWLPSTLITDDNIVWSSETAWILDLSYVAPSGQAVTLASSFDWRTRALNSLLGTVCAGDSASIKWFLQLHEWDNEGGVTVPVSGVLHENGKALYRFTVEGMAYNVDVNRWLDGEDEFATVTQRRASAHR